MRFNTSRFGTGVFGGGAFVSTMYSTDPAVFDGWSISDGSIMVMRRFVPVGLAREFVGGNVPNGNGVFQTAVREREQIFQADGYLIRSSVSNLRTYMDTVKKNLRVENAYLDRTEENGTVKRYVATFMNYDELFADEDYYNLTFIPWTMKFRVPDGYGRARSYTSEYMSFTNADSPYTKVITHAGTADSKPVVILNFTAASSVTVVNVKRTDSDGNTLDEIEYSGSISAGDILTFDSENLRVKKNGVATAYTGGFLSLEPGANILKVTVTSTSFTVGMTIKHKTTYR